MIEYDDEPVPGLPEALPEDEHMLWQGSPDWRPLFFSAWHVRLVALYFLGAMLMAAAQGRGLALLVVALAGVSVLGGLALFARAVARTTIYTLTDKRVVLRIGVALNKCINLPLACLSAAHLKALGDGHGSIVLDIKGPSPLGYFTLWPHARSLRLVKPKPMLRAIPDAQHVAGLLLRATSKVQTVRAGETPAPRAATPQLGGWEVPA